MTVNIETHARLILIVFTSCEIGRDNSLHEDEECNMISSITKKTVRIIEREIGGAVAEWVERDRVVPGSNPAAAIYSLQNFGNSVYPVLSVSFGRDTKSRRSLLSGGYATGSKRSHQSALEMCNLSWTPPPTRDHTASWTTLEIRHYKIFVCYPVNMMCSKSNQIK